MLDWTCISRAASSSPTTSTLPWVIPVLGYYSAEYQQFVFYLKRLVQVIKMVKHRKLSIVVVCFKTSILIKYKL